MRRRPLFSAQAAQIRLRLFFSCLYLRTELIFHAQAAGILAWCHFGFSQGMAHASRGPLIYAQHVWIRLRHFIHMVVYTSGACILCAGCGDPRLLHFGFFLGMPCGLSMSLWWLFFTQTVLICVRNHLIVTPARSRTVASSGLSWARLGSPGLAWAFLGYPELS